MVSSKRSMISSGKSMSCHGSLHLYVYSLYSLAGCWSVSFRSITVLILMVWRWLMRLSPFLMGHCQWILWVFILPSFQSCWHGNRACLNWGLLQISNSYRDMMSMVILMGMGCHTRDLMNLEGLLERQLVVRFLVGNKRLKIHIHTLVMTCLYFNSCYGPLLYLKWRVLCSQLCI